MKKFLVMALAMFFVTATSGLVLADTPATTSPAVSTGHKTPHKGRHHKKGKKAPAAVAPAPTK